ncbi:MAG: Bug family tripartite tricarboxylate transporter substrate binding protein [Achromobacter veterisilvae]
MPTRRLFLLGASALLASPVFGSSPWPAKPLRIVVPFPAGGPTDFVVRQISASLAAELGQPVIIENRPGVSGNLGAQAVAESEPDGYTLIHNTVGVQAINPLMFPEARVNPQKDFIGIATTASMPNVVVVNPQKLPVKTLQELVEMGRERPNRLSVATFGLGTSAHIYGALLQKLGEFKAVEVPYRGSALALTDVLGGQVDFLFDSMTTSINHVKAGTLRALAVTAPARTSLLPDVPTMAEAGFPGMDLKFWFALYAPVRTPTPIVERLRAVLHQVLSDPAYASGLRERGAEPLVTPPSELDRFLAADTQRWAEAARQIGIKAQA